MIEAVFIKNFNSTLFSFKKLAKISDLEKREKFLIKSGEVSGTKKLMKIQKKKEKEEERLSKEINVWYDKENIYNYKTYPTLGAYVIFDRY